mmetsp:Transcript_20910/g.57540  ORF Transcript_20910/g.57540 Transcript_20910/m.57540 type:complete len:484 (+) Transcript_20910:130-1581(+)
MPWIPPVPTKVSAGDDAKHNDLQALNIELGDGRKCHKRFCVQVTKQSVNSELESEGSDEPEMTSSTFKSMNRTKVIALQSHGKRRLNDSSDSRPTTSSFNSPFDIPDSDSETNSQAPLDSPLSSSKNLSTAEPHESRTILGVVDVDVTGAHLYKDAASQPRTAGSPVYLVRQKGSKVDCLKVMLHEGSGHIGHIPQSLSQLLTPLLDANLIELKATLTASFQGGSKVKISKSIPISIKVYENSGVHLAAGLEAIKTQLMSVLQTGVLTRSEEAREIVGKVIKDPEDSIAVSLAPLAERVPISRTRSVKELSRKATLLLHELSPPQIPFCIGHSLDLLGILNKAAYKNIKLCPQESVPKNRLEGFEKAFTCQSNDIDQTIDEKLEDTQAAFDLALLEARQFEKQVYKKKLAAICSETSQSRAVTRMAHSVKEANRGERSSKMAGMRVVSIDSLQQQGLEISEEEAIDQGLYLPIIGDAVLAYLC